MSAPLQMPMRRPEARRHGKDEPARRGEYVLLQLALPARPVTSVGVLLLDPESDRLYPKLRSNWKEIADPEDVDVLVELERDIELKIQEMGGQAFLSSLEDSLSNSLLLTNRRTVAVRDFPGALETLFREHVDSRVLPFVTHLPLYSLRAAATKFGEDTEVEQEDWIQAPERLRLSRDMFVARVVGRSMEPRIPDGSLCIFRANVVGSRQGKLLLVEKFGTTESSARYSIKKYTSRKAPAAEGGWRHESIRLEPLNPEFEGFELKEGECRILAEFVQVLE